MRHFLVILALTPSKIMPSTAEASATMVDVIDMIDLIVNDAFNGSYLSRTPFRGMDSNTSFIPGKNSIFQYLGGGGG
jgi:hypothetical protein